MTTGDLFADHSPADDARIALGEAAFVLRGFALSEAPGLIAAVDAIAQQAAFRHMVTPGGFEMSVALTNSGELGWTSDRRGYRYATLDPLTGNPWPPLPDAFVRLARNAAAEAGFPAFTPDACLINRYVPGARMSLHQDKDEQDYSAPIVSVSLGMPAVFLFGGHRRADKAQRIPLFHGDVVVWGGPDRLRYHGVAPLKDHPHASLGSQRINLTFRKAG
ncbi:DNA oxidative demethylase AlkB [Ralstonia sp. UNC404CL21Col]|uniref:DNA oxidative demethylase AlkB n=1 Tax=Ralstonia sp. UNC404CL21Col TaxID=1380362 RepID=UPI000486F1D8|nr:DNA oxidative demethylase AlkB [Ralstonia sp. UNC404CL21Col]